MERHGEPLWPAKSLSKGQVKLCICTMVWVKVIRWWMLQATTLGSLGYFLGENAHRKGILLDPNQPAIISCLFSASKKEICDRQPWHQTRINMCRLHWNPRMELQSKLLWVKTCQNHHSPKVIKIWVFVSLRNGAGPLDEPQWLAMANHQCYASAGREKCSHGHWPGWVSQTLAMGWTSNWRWFIASMPAYKKAQLGVFMLGLAKYIIYIYILHVPGWRKESQSKRHVSNLGEASLQDSKIEHQAMRFHTVSDIWGFYPHHEFHELPAFPSARRASPWASHRASSCQCFYAAVTDRFKRFGFTRFYSSRVMLRSI